MITVEKDLSRKYDVPGPRYTSYPVIVYWDAQPTTAEWIQSVAASLAPNRAIFFPGTTRDKLVFEA